VGAAVLAGRLQRATTAPFTALSLQALTALAQLAPRPAPGWRL